LIEVCFYEWPFYRDHLYLIPALWLGGMATHGLLIGAVGGVLMFCRKYRVSFFKTTDILVVPAAFILGCGRVGNFIDGNIVGSPADVWWAVEFPDAEGFRHPVVLYDGLKNFLLIPLLLWIGKRRLQAGVLSGIFLFLYAALRIGIDTFREYPTSLLGLATGQFLNLMIAAAGIFLSMRGLGQQMQRMQMGPELRGAPHAEAHAAGLTWRRVALGVLIAFALTIPSDWTADVPERYAKRHPGLSRSALYPRIEIKPNGVLSGSASGGGSAREIVVNNNRTQF
jgi:phosphatidylglycerol:prolipoprotein diacylglycerol transferase